MTSEGIQRPLVFGFVALGLIRAGRLLHKIGNLRHEFGFSGLHASMAHGLVSVGVGLDLRAINGHGAQLDHQGRMVCLVA